MHIIHFTTLEDLLDDAPIGATIYVCHQSTTKTEQDNAGIPYRTTQVQAFARIADAGAVLSYTPYVQQVTTMNLPGFDPEDQAKHKRINDRAIAIANSMLQIVSLDGYRTRKAIVDLHGAQPVQGRAWELSEEEQREEEDNHHEPA